MQRPGFLTQTKFCTAVHREEGKTCCDPHFWSDCGNAAKMNRSVNTLPRCAAPYLAFSKSRRSLHVRVSAAAAVSGHVHGAHESIGSAVLGGGAAVAQVGKEVFTNHLTWVGIEWLARTLLACAGAMSRHMSDLQVRRTGCTAPCTNESRVVRLQPSCKIWVDRAHSRWLEGY